MVADGFFMEDGLFFLLLAREGSALGVFFVLVRGVGLIVDFGVPNFFGVGLIIDLGVSVFFAAVTGVALALDFGVSTFFARGVDLMADFVVLLIFFEAEDTPLRTFLGWALPRDLGVDLRPALIVGNRFGTVKIPDPGSALAGSGEFLVSLINPFF